MVARGTNKIIKVENGVVCFDVSTPSLPGRVAQIDEADLSRVLDGGNRWRATMRATSGPYVVRWDGGDREVLLHRHLTGVSGRLALCDHENGDGLDNRQINLRLANHSQNGANAQSHRDSVHSTYLGVDKHENRWRARLKHKGNVVSLGRFATEIEAARAYDAGAKKHHGEFANLNFPDG